MSDPTAVMVPLTTAIVVFGSILGPMAAAVAWLARALVAAHKERVASIEIAQAAREAESAAAKAAYDARVEKHIEDVRAAGSVLAEHQRNTLPLISELAAHFQLANTRAAARHRREDEGSDPPRSSSTEDTLTQIRKLAERGGA